MTAAPEYVVVDANVIVYLITRSPVSAAFEPYLIGKIGLISFQTVAELRLIGRRRRWGLRKSEELEQRLRQLVVVPATDEITRTWAQLMYEQMVDGSRIEPPDAWVAATDIVYRCPVLTNDRKDFERIRGLTLLPP